MSSVRWISLLLTFTAALVAVGTIISSNQTSPDELFGPGLDDEMNKLLKDAVSSERKDVAKQRTERAKIMARVKEGNSPLPTSKKETESDIRLLKDAEAEQNRQLKKEKLARAKLDEEAHRHKKSSASAAKLLKDALKEQHEEDSKQTAAFKKDITKEVEGNLDVGHRKKEAAVEKELREILGPQEVKAKLTKGQKQSAVQKAASKLSHHGALSREEEKKLYSFLSTGPKIIPEKIEPNGKAKAHSKKSSANDKLLREARLWGAKKAHIKPPDTDDDDDDDNNTNDDDDNDDDDDDDSKSKAKTSRTRSQSSTEDKSGHSSSTHSAHVRHRLHSLRSHAHHSSSSDQDASGHVSGHAAKKGHEDSTDLAPKKHVDMHDSYLHLSKAYKSPNMLTARKARALKQALRNTIMSLPHVKVPKHIGSLDNTLFT